MLASINLNGIAGTTDRGPPTALAVSPVDGTCEDAARGPTVVVGFQDGSFCLFNLNEPDKTFDLVYTHSASTNGMLSAVALSWPYLATMTAGQLLSVYKVSEGGKPGEQTRQPVLLHSLQSRSNISASTSGGISLVSETAGVFPIGSKYRSIGQKIGYDMLEAVPRWRCRAVNQRCRDPSRNCVEHA